MANTFTPEQIAQILEEFFKTVGTRQYIGARYVPIFGRKGEDSIEWDNTGTYEPLTIVLYQGNSYTSRQYVPVGVEITNQAFWALTGNYNAQVELYRRETAAAREAAEAAQADIDTLLPKNAFSAETTIKDYIDDKNAETTQYIDENITRVLAFDTVADMQQATYLKAGMVCHTNGFNSAGDGGAAFYVLTVSGVANGMDVLACGELFANYVYCGEANVLQFGAKNDSSADVSGIFNAMTAKYDLYFPVGKYLVENTLIPQKDVKGFSFKKLNWTESYEGKASILESRATGAAVRLSYPDLTIDSMVINCGANETGIEITGENRYYQVSNVTVLNVGGIGINVNPTVGQSRVAYLDNISIVGNESYVENTGIIFGERAYDCRASNVEIMRVQHGIVNYAIVFVSNAHIWCGTYGRTGTPSDNWMKGTVCILNRSGTFSGTNIYTDTAWRHLTPTTSGHIIISNLIAYDDNTLEWSTPSLLVNADFVSNVSIAGGYVRFRNNFTGVCSRWYNAEIKLSNVVFRSDITTKDMLDLPSVQDSYRYIIPAQRTDYFVLAVIKEFVSGVTKLHISLFQYDATLSIKNVNDTLTLTIEQSTLPSTCHLGYVYDANTTLLKIYVNRDGGSEVLQPFVVEEVSSSWNIVVDRDLLSQTTILRLFDSSETQPTDYVLIQ